MSESIGKEQFEIAALQQKTVKSVNMMMPGNGTPWEDRGSLGAISAFLKTCWRSLTSHNLLLDHIRRPETTGESTKFAAGCAFVWAVSLAIWNTIYWFRVSKDPMHWDVIGSQFLIESILQSLIAFFLVLLLLRVGASMYVKLIAGEASSRVPAVLVYNTFAYSLGPSILALIPVVGWALAILWIYIDLVIAGRRRLYLGGTGTVINSLLVMAVAGIMVGGVWVVSWFVWVKLGIIFNEASATPHVLPPIKPMNS